MVQLDFSPEIEVFNVLVKIEKALSNSIQHTSISCVKLSYTTQLYTVSHDIRPRNADDSALVECQTLTLVLDVLDMISTLNFELYCQFCLTWTFSFSAQSCQSLRRSWSARYVSRADSEWLGTSIRRRRLLSNVRKRCENHNGEMSSE